MPLKRLGIGSAMSGLSGLSGLSVGGYDQKVLSIPDLLGYWPLSDIAEPVGRIAPDLSGNGFDGLYFTGGVTYNIDGPGDGLPAINLDGTGNVCLYSAGLAAALDLAELTISIWIQIAASEWADATFRVMAQFGASTTNRTFIRKSTAADVVNFVHRGGGSTDIISHAFSPQEKTGWINYAVTVSESNDRMRAYINGTQTGADLTDLGINSGSLAADLAAAGSALCSAASSPLIGDIGRVALFSRELTAPEMAQIGVI